MKGKEFLGGILVGAIIGAAMGLLLAPQSGEETREAVREHARELGEKVKDSSRSLLENGRDMIEQSKSQLTEAIKRGTMQNEGTAKSTVDDAPEA